ncbi:cytochrome c biogenesis CcdA family protein [Bradyrhizobium genosp. P]|uniref:cytochrome c biogenesis CcdA family protein n=1 Tax=Bradyrhizobium genosp. P TaxID=83641 RepID=UPI003CFB3186
MLGTLGLAFLAGVLSILSPCVLPLLPVVLGAAASEHRLGPVALAGGLSLSFVAIGLFIATIGFGLGIGGDLFRLVAAVLMIGIGCVLALPPLQNRLAAAGGPLGNWTYQRFGGFSTSGLGGQFGLGLLLGAVWSPCVGPTLGAASVLAAQGKDLGAVALTMLAFGLGAGLPLLLFGALSHQLPLRWRDGMSMAGKSTKRVLGIFLVLVGLLIVTGLDKTVETKLVDASPQWLTGLTTRF